jgi:hypothetical protein
MNISFNARQQFSIASRELDFMALGEPINGPKHIFCQDRKPTHKNKERELNRNNTGIDLPYQESFVTSARLCPSLYDI